MVPVSSIPLIQEPILEKGQEKEKEKEEVRVKEKVKEKVKVKENENENENEKEKEKEKEEEEDVISTDDFVSSSKNVKSLEKVERASQMLSDAIFDLVTDEGKLTAQAQQEFFQLHDSRSDLCFFHLFLFIFFSFFLMFKNITVQIANFLYVSIFCHN